MNQQKADPAELQRMNRMEPDRPASWGEGLIALGPFLLMPVILVLYSLFTGWLKIQAGTEPGIGLAFVLSGIILLILTVGWVQGFPRWVFPYWGFALLITIYLQNFTGTLFGNRFMGSWRVWMPLLGVVMIGLLWKRNFQPIQRLLGSIWKDWTLLSFTFYGALPLLYMAAFEETHNRELVLGSVMLILAAGAWLYMRSRTIRQRFGWLVAGFSLSWVVTMAYLSLYWNGRQEAGMSEPASWMGTLNWTSRQGFTLIAILMAPLLIEFIQRMERSVRSQKAT